MAALTIRRLDDNVKARLRVRAARNGRSMEEEARHILGEALDESVDVNATPGSRLVETFRKVFGAENGVELELPSRKGGRRLPDFSDWPEPTS